MSARRVGQVARVVLLAVAVGLVVVLSLRAGPPPAEEQAASRTYVVQVPDRLDCWGEDGEEHPFPTRVVYRHGGGDWLVGGGGVVDQALDQIFNGVDHGLDVYRFCVLEEVER